MDRFERDVLVGVGRFTLSPFTLLGYSMIFMLWMIFVGPFQLVYWIYELAVWIVATCKRRPFSLRITVETFYFTPPWGMDRYQHPSKRRRARLRQLQRDRHLTDADRTLHLERLLSARQKVSA